MSNTNSPSALEGTPEHGCDRKWEPTENGDFQSEYYNGKCFFTEHLDDGVKNASLNTVKRYGDKHYCAMHAEAPSEDDLEERQEQQEAIIMALQVFYITANAAIKKNEFPEGEFGNLSSDENIVIFHQCHVVADFMLQAYMASMLLVSSHFNSIIAFDIAALMRIQFCHFKQLVNLMAVNSKCSFGHLVCSDTTYDNDAFVINFHIVELATCTFKRACFFSENRSYIYDESFPPFSSCYLGNNNIFEKSFPIFVGVDLPLQHSLPTTIGAYPFMKQRVSVCFTIWKLVKAIGRFIVDLVKALFSFKGWLKNITSTCSQFTETIIKEDKDNKNAAHDLFLMTRQLKESNTAGFYMYLEESCKGWKGNILAKLYNVLFGSGYSLGRPLVWYLLMFAFAVLILRTSASSIPLSSYLLHGLWPLGIISQFKASWWQEALLFGVSLFQLLSMFIFGLAVSWRSRKRG